MYIRHTKGIRDFLVLPTAGLWNGSTVKSLIDEIHKVDNGVKQILGFNCENLTIWWDQFTASIKLNDTICLLSICLLINHLSSQEILKAFKMNAF